MIGNWRESVDWVAGKRCSCGGSVFIAGTPCNEPNERMTKCGNVCGEVYEEDLVEEDD